MSANRVSGFVAKGFEPVRAAFEADIASGREIGASFAAYRNGEPLVDLWGGIADRASGRPMDHDSLMLIFSGTKGITAICLMMLMSRGKLDLEAPVSRYWPEFGKPQITVRHVVSHTARLPGVSPTVTAEDMWNPKRLTELLEQQEPFTDPRAAYTYHGLSFGWLTAELLRRVDGRTVGQFFEGEIRRPLELEFWIGLPEALEARLATIEVTDGWAANPLFAAPKPGDQQADPLHYAVWKNPRTLAPDVFIWNRREVHAAEMPASNGIGTARSIAKLYSIVAAGGGSLMRPEIAALASKPLVRGIDGLLNEERSNSIGFQLQLPQNRRFGEPDNAFGHDGAGGSMHGGWPDLGVGFSYSMNLLCDGSDGPPRHEPMLAALAASLDA